MGPKGPLATNQLVSASGALQKVRFESFGGIVGLTDPPALVFVDQKYMQELGFQDSPLWHQTSSHLSAPTEVHFNLTRRCTLSCRHCTADSITAVEKELPHAEVKAGIDVLAQQGVFHVAFGGGELFLRDDALDLARYARRQGLIPNATTNGQSLTPRLAQECKVFGQVNVSLDGVGDRYGCVRGAGSYALADQALRSLVRAGVSTGINCVISQVNFDFLEDVVAYAERLQLKEVLFLRLKPSGRATRVYHDYVLLPEQARRLYGVLKRLAKRYRVALQIDCSLVPHICYHRPSLRAMRLLGVEGCSAGNLLLGVTAQGKLQACSHSPEAIGNLLDLPSLWLEHGHFHRFRERSVRDHRCLECKYFELCRGGCPLFSEFLVGDFNAPDPECPVLVAAR